MKRGLIIFFILLISIPAAIADEVLTINETQKESDNVTGQISIYENRAASITHLDELWESAASLYAKGDFSESLLHYLRIEELGYASEPLFYNIANCYFKRKEWGRSILYYERALRLNPSDKDIQYNLNLARDFTIDKIDKLPEFVLKTWLRGINYMLSADMWTYISLLLFAITALLLLNFRYGPGPGIRKLSFFLSLLSLLAGVIFSLFAMNQRNAYNNNNEAIILVPVSTVKSSPDASGNTLFILHEGTKVEFTGEKIGAWTKIELSDGRQGWIQSEDLVVI
jgi:tetratricopeptide (TPR) repeat protein